jgi:hypothetical protein
MRRTLLCLLTVFSLAASAQAQAPAKQASAKQTSAS